MASFGEKLDASRGLGPGFDILRLGLAVAVVFWHSFILTPHQIAPEYRPLVWLPHFATLSMFFALSGFLISGSALRLNLQNFLLNRGLRIFPALAVEIVLSAFVLGPVFTNLPLFVYFSSRDTYRYLTNIIALINYELPGVFGNNPSHLVNASLWTVPGEFLCYFIMSLFIVLGTLKQPARTTLVALIVTATGFVMIRLGYSAHTPGWPGLVFQHFQIGPTTRVVTAFVVGVVFYQLRYRIRYSSVLAAVCIVALALIDFFPSETFDEPLKGLLTVVPLVYLTVFVGASNVPTPKFLHRGDYSYGIYLYGYPVQQAVYTLTPAIHSPWLQFLMALPLIVLFAMLSWHYIEKPILAQRRRFSFVAKVRGVAEEAAAGAHPPAASQPLIAQASTSRHAG